jgi:outer membrane protein TolC
MPQFRYGDAMFARYELMQMIPFPTKLSGRASVATIVADHAHHEHMETVFEVVVKVKSAFLELWYAQQAMALAERNVRLTGQFAEVARTRYASGGGSLDEVLKADVESSRQRSQLESLRRQERGTKAMLRGLLARAESDTLGRAVLPDSVPALPGEDALIAAALVRRPMLQHDSLGIIEWKAMRSLASQEYLPDFRIGLQYMTSPLDGFNGWTITLGISLPFVPWAAGNPSGKVEEAEAGIGKAVATLKNSRAMVTSSVQELYQRAAGQADRLRWYRTSIVPRARQALDASITGYQAGTTDFLMMLDSYRMQVDLSMESLMLRMEYEQTVARLEREIGTMDIARYRAVEGELR